MGMIEIKGKYGTAKVFTENVEEGTQRQIFEVLNESFIEGSKVRIMPDTHVGKGAVIGTTMTITDKVVPNLVGVDIGCGMHCVKLDVQAEAIDFGKLDEVIRKYVPSGQNARDKMHTFAKEVNLDGVRAPFNRGRAENSIGTLGGGNHFLEVAQGADGSVYLVIHSGSRHLGKQVAEHYQKVAVKRAEDRSEGVQAIVDKLKAEGRHREIEGAVSEYKRSVGVVNRMLAYVTGSDMDDYLNDLRIAQHYALTNRRAMAYEVMENMGWAEVERFDTIHNYVDLEHMILRKGAISAQEGERVIIPLNMRDGSIIAVGKGNPDWNYSGPHGAGRIMSRSKAKEAVKIEDFKETMEGIWSTSVLESTLDESPFAYKPMEEILGNITETVDVLEVIKPLYNFKAN